MHSRQHTDPAVGLPGRVETEVLLRDFDVDPLDHPVERRCRDALRDQGAHKRAQDGLHPFREHVAALLSLHASGLNLRGKKSHGLP